MRYYPVNLNLEHRQCLVVGGGAVGTRKVRSLLECGARVTVISPEVSEKLTSLSNKSKIRLVSRPFKTTDLEGVFLVIGATDDENLNRRIHREAERLGLLCNIADRPEVCNFILPSVVRVTHCRHGPPAAGVTGADSAGGPKRRILAWAQRAMHDQKGFIRYSGRFHPLPVDHRAHDGKSTRKAAIAAKPA